MVLNFFYNGHFKINREKSINVFLEIFLIGIMQNVLSIWLNLSSD